MSSSILEEEFELNYIKIDSKNDIRLLETKEYEKEITTFFKAVNKYENENIDQNISSFLKKIIPENSDILKLNIDYSKQFLKILNADKKKGFNSSINHFLSTDFKDQFIFNKKNLLDVCNILTLSFNEIKKEGKNYKIINGKDFINAIDHVKVNKYDFFKIFVNSEYLKNREKIDQTVSSSSSRGKSTAFSSFSIQVKDDDNYEEENINRYHNEARGVYYVDTNIKNVICSSMLTDDYNYNEEEELKKLLTKECFLYPKNNKSALPETNELPIELILLLDKLKNVKSLIFQIQNVDEFFIRLSIFVLINVKWLFVSGINEIKFDLGNDEIQKGLIEKYSQRATELYHSYQKIKNLNYCEGSYQARTINCWEPEGDIFFEKDNQINDNITKKDYSYNMQSNEDASTFDNYLSNIYNEFGNLTKLKYIRPFEYIIKNKDNQKREDSDEFSNMIIDDQKVDKDKDNISVSSSATFNSKKTGHNHPLTPTQTISSNNISNTHVNRKNQTRNLIGEVISKYTSNLDMILVYSHFFTTNLKSIKKLGLYFQSPFSYEICLKQKASSIEQSHFLILANKIESLKEINFSFNALDDKSFIKLLVIIFKNEHLSSLRLSFFTPDINYYCDSLFSILYSKKTGVGKCFQEQKEYEILNNQDKVKSMENFILNEKLLDSFSVNLSNFCNILKLKNLNNLEELIMRFDMPLPLLDNQKYIILMIKFIINVIIMITFQKNKINTLKLIAPYLEVNGTNLPYIKQFFREITLTDETDDLMDNENFIKKANTTKVMGTKELKEKEKEKEIEKKSKVYKGKKYISQKSVKLDILDNVTRQPTESIIEENIENEKIEEESNENFGFKRFNSVMPKNSLEQAIKQEESINIEELLIKKRSALNINSSLENLTMQFKIYDLPEIFNICLMNNLSGLKSINLGSFDEMTFIGFMNYYRKYSNNLINLTSLKISLGISVISYLNLEKYIIEYININTPRLEEKLLFSDLKIINENKMRDLIQLVYVDAIVPKLVIQISHENTNLLAKVLSEFIKQQKEICRNEMNSMILVMCVPEYKKLYSQIILECLSSFYGMRKNRVIICKEN